MAENDPASGVQHRTLVSDEVSSILEHHHGLDPVNLGEELCVLGLEDLDLLPLALDLDSFTFLLFPNGKTLDPDRLVMCLILLYDTIDSF